MTSGAVTTSDRTAKEGRSPDPSRTPAQRSSRPSPPYPMPLVSRRPTSPPPLRPRPKRLPSPPLRLLQLRQAHPDRGAPARPVRATLRRQHVQAGMSISTSAENPRFHRERTWRTIPANGLQIDFFQSYAWLTDVRTTAAHARVPVARRARSANVPQHFSPRLTSLKSWASSARSSCCDTVASC